MGSDDSDEVDERDRVLAPDDLDITRQPEVAEIDDGRYVVSPSGPAKKPDRELLENPDWLDNDPDDTDDQQPATQSTRQPAADRTSSQQPTQGNPNQSPDRQSTPPNQHTDQPPRSDSQPGTRGQPSTDHSQPTAQPPADDTTPRQQPSTDRQNSAGQPERSQQPQNSHPSQQPNRSTHSQESQQPQRSDQPAQSTPSDTAQSSGQPATQPNSGATQPNSGATQRADKPTNRDLAAHDQPPAEPPAAEITNENVSKFLAQSLAQSSGDYGFDATLNVEGKVNRGRMTSDDVGETLETLLRWYAKQTTDEVEPERVLGIILAGSDLAVEYPVQSAYEVVKQHGLGPDDSISDLLSAIRDEGSFTVPPSKE